MAARERAVVYLPGVPFDAVRGTDRHLAEKLARRVPVVWIDPPLSVVHRKQPSGRTLPPLRLRQPVPGLTWVTYLAPPFPERRWVRPVTSVWGRLIVAGVLNRLEIEPAAVINTSPTTDFDLVPADTARRLYYATDDFVAGASLMGMSERLLSDQQGRRLLQADVVAAVSAEIMSNWPADVPRLVVPNGCDVETFADTDEVAPALDVELEEPMAGLFGQVSSRIDLGLLEALCDSGVRLLIVGPAVRTLDRGRFDALVSRPNVQWTGSRPFESLPSYARWTSLGLTPYEDTQFNRASFPLKSLEYLAAGRPVLSTPLPAVAALGSPDIHTASDAQDFVTVAKQLLEGNDRCEERARRQRFAEQHSWQRRADGLLEHLGLEEFSAAGAVRRDGR